MSEHFANLYKEEDGMFVRRWKPGEEPAPAPVERPELPALDVTDKQRPQYVMFDPPLPNDVQCRVPKDVCGGMYRAADADDIFEYLEAELLSAQSRIRELEQREKWSERQVTMHSEIAANQQWHKEKAETERDQLKAEMEELTKNRDQWERNSAAENSRAGDALVAMRRLKADILAITETPEWFITPCAQAVREVLEEK